MKPALLPDDALERLHRAVGRILRDNSIEYSRVFVMPVQSGAQGAIFADVRITAHEQFSTRIPLTVFDSDDELMLRIARGLAPLNGRSRLDTRHEFIYCWCGHSGDDVRNEMGAHIMNPGLVCPKCECEPPEESAPFRPAAIRCPCCSFGALPFKSPYDRTKYCDHCRGLGYLKPSFYC
jgi:hypothetical protein